MSGLPPMVARAPSLFFAGAVIFFVLSLLLSIFELNSSMGDVERTNPMYRLGVLRAALQAAEAAVYIAANGVVARLLIAIWEAVAAQRARGVEE